MPYRDLRDYIKLELDKRTYYRWSTRQDFMEKACERAGLNSACRR